MLHMIDMDDDNHLPVIGALDCLLGYDSVLLGHAAVALSLRYGVPARLRRCS